MEQQLTIIEGTVENIVFQNEDNGFTVLELDRNDELLTVVGEMHGVQAGERLKLHGFFVNHANYGMQFKAQLCERTLPSTAGAIEKYLASGAVKGIGPIFARRLVEAFGDQTLEVLEKEPHRLTEVRGISPAKAQKIAQEYGRLFGIRAIMMYLSKFDIPSAAAIAVWKRWGADSKGVIENNPYILCAEDFGLTFETCEDIAKTLENPVEPKKRMKAAISYILKGNTYNGHTCLPKDKLCSTALNLTEDGINVFEDALDEEIEEQNLVSAVTNLREYIYLPWMYEAENFVADRVRLMLMLDKGVSKDYSKEIAKLEKENGIKYAERQKQAIQAALDNKLFILTGGPGTGKTTAINAIIALLEKQGETVFLAAPTGRAAQRMAQVTGREAKTIHRMLEVDFTDTRTLKFRRCANNPLPCTAVIVDEVSMVDITLMQSLFNAMKMGARLILVGDADQLPSVGAGNVLRDFIASDKIACVQLKEIFRQAAQSMIVTNAHAIVEGKMPVLNCKDNDFFFLNRTQPQAMLETVVDLCSRRLPASYGYSPTADIQVIAPTRIGAVGTVQLNRALQEKLNPKREGKTEAVIEGRTFRENDKVMQTKNNYDLPWTSEDGESGMGVYNGDIGIISMIDRGSKTILVDYDGKTAEYSFELAGQLEHAYAITVHKSQGSEFEAVVMPITPYSSKMHYRNLLYTAVTRAKNRLVLLGTAEVVGKMVENNRKTVRYTNLLEMLTDEME